MKGRLSSVLRLYEVDHTDKNGCTCSAWTNKLITAKDHAAVQLNIGHLNEEGMYNGSTTTFAFSGSVRAMVRLPFL